MHAACIMCQLGNDFWDVKPNTRAMALPQDSKHAFISIKSLTDAFVTHD